MAEIEIGIDLDLGLGDPKRDVVNVFRSKSKLRKQRWYWRRTAVGPQKILSRSSEGYYDKAFCIKMALRCNPDKGIETLLIEGGLVDVDLGVDLQLPPLPPMPDGHYGL